MHSEQWHFFIRTSIEVLGEGKPIIDLSDSWCSWTTFSRLECWDAGYWQSGLPSLKQVETWGIADGGVWGQPFKYSEIAHFIIPHKFCTEAGVVKTQDTESLGHKLHDLGEAIQMNKYVLEVKLY